MRSGTTPRRAVRHAATRTPTTVPIDRGSFAGLVRADAILSPVQFGDIWHRSRPRGRAEQLALAVVQQATDDLRRYRYARGRSSQRLYRDAYEWVTADDRAWPYSFVNLCEVLRLSPSALRARLLNASLRHESEAA